MSLDKKVLSDKAKRRFLIGIIVFVLIFVIFSVLVVLLNHGKLSNFYSLPEDMASLNEDSTYCGSLLGENKKVVYYPNVENGNLEDKLYWNAKEILGVIDKDERVSVDYIATIYNDKYMGITYQYNGQEWNSFYTLDGEELLLDNSYFDDFLKTQVVYETRAAAKQVENFSQYAQSTEFAKATAEDNIPYEFILIEDKIRIIYEDFYEGESFSFDMELSMYSSHIDLDIAVEQTVEEGVVAIPTRYVDTDKPMVALTFDDGPAPGTQEIVDALYENDGVATFYMLGQNAFKESYEETIINVINGGNEIGSHSVSHPYLPSLTGDEDDEKELEKELFKVQEYIYNMTGEEYVVETYRAPYGVTNKVIEKKAEFPFIYWTIDTLDWKYRNANKVFNKVMNSVEDGDIILMHDIHEESVEAALMLIPALKEAGYQLVTVSELMDAKGIKMVDGKTY